MVVSEQAILDALHQIPVERWDEVLLFLQRQNPGEQAVYTAADLLQSGLVGLWADRDDIGDSREFARRLRRQAENRHEAPDATGQFLDIP
ncbi:MAG TPA: hypothetical protein DDY78_23220 [Planctomycetales bacterium]|jgi:hypothetical protein|nr:hypothetical protein [Planctomycetales bacterium]